MPDVPDQLRTRTLSPSRLLVAAAGGWAMIGLGAAEWPALVPWWHGYGLALGTIAIVDAWRSRVLPSLRVERELAGVWPVGRWNEVTLRIHNEGTRTVATEVFDDAPGAWEIEGMPHASKIAGSAFASITYRLRPDQRGNAAFGPAYLRVMSTLGLWTRTHRIGPHDTVKVFPDFSSLLGHTLSATDRRSAAMGPIRKRRRGEGTDFRQLRDYRRGDSLRSIDWKATARRNKPITREYQEERDQQVVFLLDTGRRMLARDDVTSHFDHALNAVLTLGFVAQKQGDAVGLMTFGGATRWVAPAKGRTGLDRLLAAAYDVQPGEMAPDYTAAAGALLDRLHKRSFVVLITSLRDEDDHALRTACQLMSSRHLVMCASLREKVLDETGAAPVRTLNEALCYSATVHYMQQRRQAIERMGIRADRLIDVTPDRLSHALVDRYIDFKESGAL